MHPITWRKSRLRLKTYKSHPRSVVGATSTELLGLSSIFLYLTPWMMDCAQLYISHHPTRRDKTVASSRRVWWCEFATRGAKLAVVVWLYLCRQMCFVAGHTEDLSRDFYLVTNDVASLLRLWSSLMLEQNDLPAVYWHLPSSMRNWVYETVGCPSVRPSVRPSVSPIFRLQQWRPADLLSAPQAGDIDRQRRAPEAQQQMRAVSCWQPSCLGWTQTFYVIEIKLFPVSIHCKSHRCKTANMTKLCASSACWY